ncbi:oxysterol-binding protein-related protein 1-like isoform X3 [Dunckerocampus dactyliophorus]|uniref:oxysterol-binding protein-related protein 1-like isoform X3 n=1 Tax=Dunckerocampus dactyliophorus TaxID=161453 RepID=UPI002406C34C|nr:oxysterol-binding protein-related protein 1-like isoform X3 [Dunckerocampus dactyliophorus]
MEEQQLLESAKDGSRFHVQRLLQSRIEQNTSLNINCRSKSKGTPGWTPLHMACYHGNTDVVEALLKEIVLLLLRYDAFASVINGTGQIPKDVTDDDEIITMLEAAERREARRQEERLLEAAREGDVSALSKLLSGKEAVNVHCKDSVGNTPLHCAAYRGHKQCIIQLLKCGACPTVKNNKEQTSLDLVRTDELKQILTAHQDKDGSSRVKKIEGPLWKSSRFLGWRLNWVVIEDGTVSWYHRQAESVAGVRKQGWKSLAKAYCMVKPWDHCFFMLRCADDSALCFKVPSKMDSVATRKMWLDAFEAHSSYSTQNCTQQELIEHADTEGGDFATSNITQAVQAASACQQKLESEVSIFQSMVKNENCDLAASLLLKAKETSELSSETSAALQLCLQLLSSQEEVWTLKLEQEVEKNKALTEALQTIATEHHKLKQSLCRSRRSSTLSTLTEDEFYDALSESESELSVSGFLSVASNSCEEDEGSDAPLLSSLCHPSTLRGAARMSGEGNQGNQNNAAKKHRTSLPAPMFPRNDVSIWSILKKCIGMELSKIAMPVIFNEPLSFLQRITEYMEHTYLIHQANATTDSVERMKCVAAFAVSAVASQWERTGKPFNPLLGETYELIRDDLGFRWVSEQVSHHPPVSAFHAEGLKEDFVFHGSIYPKLKFWGKSIEAEPKGIITLELPKYNEAYTWTNPICCVHNIIVGQLWIEQYGSMEVVNHKTGERCSITFKPCGLFGKELHKVEGYILDKSKKKLCAIYGKWTECLYTVDPATFDSHKKSDKKTFEEKKPSKRSSMDEETEEMPPPEAETVQVIPGSELIWKMTPRPDNSAKVREFEMMFCLFTHPTTVLSPLQFYAFSKFAMQLNELVNRVEGVLPSTDSRLRPDIRAMENGDIDVASAEKKRLEEKQRMARKNRGKSTDDWKTRWFQQGPNPHNKAQDWLYLKGYWDREYTQLPDIY